MHHRWGTIWRSLDYSILPIYEEDSGAEHPGRIIFAIVAGDVKGIGDFSVSAGKDLSGNRGDRSRSPQPSSSERVPGRGNSHYIVLLKREWAQDAPLKFHNGYLDELRNRFRLTAQVPLPDMPHFFPAGAAGEMVFEGKDVLHVDSALRGQRLFSHLESLRVLVERVADRKLTFPDFLKGLNALSLPADWRNEIVNGLFSHADNTPVAPVSKAPGLSSDIDRLMGLLQQESSGGSKLSPSLSAFLDEVGRDSTGFILRDGAARELHADLVKTLEALRGSLLNHGALAAALGFLFSLQRMARLAKGRERQLVHLWSDIPEDPASLLVGENADEGGDHTVAILLLDPQERDPAFLGRVANLAASLQCDLLLQAPGEGIPEGNAIARLAESARRSRTYFFSGGVASRVEGDNCVFRAAALAFLEGLVGSRENVDYYQHRAMVLEDQDLITEKGQARATDKLLDNVQWQASTAARVNRVNGARNKTEASFPLLTPWSDS